MTKLIQLRQRIKSIQTIEKITHAMRLIAISSHTHLKSQKNSLIKYVDTIKEYFNIVYQQSPHWISPLDTLNNKNKKTLIIIIGSQKGLCGNFNQTLFNTIHKEEPLILSNRCQIIAIGKKVADYAYTTTPNTLIHRYDIFNKNNISSITKELTQNIIKKSHNYEKVIIWSNALKTFFLQKPTRTTLLPMGSHLNKSENGTLSSPSEYKWEFSSQELLDHLSIQYLQAHLHLLLLESLLAEQAARFLSMDNATRNAKKLSDASRLQYTKLRQAKITREINELSSTFN